MHEIIITKVLRQGIGFGLTIEGGEYVFIRLQDKRLREEDLGKRVYAKLMPNDRPSTPWRTNFIDWDEVINQRGFIPDWNGGASSLP